MSQPLQAELPFMVTPFSNKSITAKLKYAYYIDIYVQV